MSSPTQCNYCTLQEIKKRAAKEGHSVKLRSERGEPVKGQRTMGTVWYVAGEWKASFLALTQHCVC